MGTNYYWFEEQKCKSCGRNTEPLQIGKWSMGWVFSLHVDPYEGIANLKDWEERFSIEGSYIEDEYDRIITTKKMMAIICDRDREDPCTWSEETYNINQAEPGPKNLLRHKIGQYCIEHGEGTWDCMEGDFC